MKTRSSPRHRLADRIGRREVWLGRAARGEELSGAAHIITNTHVLTDDGSVIFPSFSLCNQGGGAFRVVTREEFNAHACQRCARTYLTITNLPIRG